MNTAKTKQILNISAQGVLAILLFFLFVSVSVIFTLAFRPLYYLDIDHLNIPEHCPYDRETIKRNYNDLIDYNLPLTDGELKFSDLPMSESGKKHFEEVKDVFDCFKIAALVLIPISAVGIIYFSKIKKERLYLILTSAVTVLIPAILSLLIALNWEEVFVKFHTIVFNNDDWIFNSATDPVILILPSEFFMHCAIMMVALTFAMGGSCAVIWWIKRKKSDTVKMPDSDSSDDIESSDSCSSSESSSKELQNESKDSICDTAFTQ